MQRAISEHSACSLKVHEVFDLEVYDVVVPRLHILFVTSLVKSVGYCLINTNWCHFARTFHISLTFLVWAVHVNFYTLFPFNQA